MIYKYKIDIKNHIKNKSIILSMELSKEQQIAYDKYVKGHNIFITGLCGAGNTRI